MKCKTMSEEANQNAFKDFFSLCSRGDRKEADTRIQEKIAKKIPECSHCTNQDISTGFCLLCYPLASTQSLYAWKQQHLIDQSLPNKATIDPWHIFIKWKTIKLNPFRNTHGATFFHVWSLCGRATTKHINQIICKRIISPKTQIQLKWKRNQKKSIRVCCQAVTPALFMVLHPTDGSWLHAAAVKLRSLVAKIQTRTISRRLFKKTEGLCISYAQHFVRDL